MKKICLVIIVLALLIPLVTFAAVGVPVGGLVAFQYPCNTGFLLYVATAKGVIPLMWLYGNLPFSSYIPPHVGQWIVGEAAPVPVPCMVGFYPIGVGLPIIYHGSSL